jgi:hypothetical protein
VQVEEMVFQVLFQVHPYYTQVVADLETFGLAGNTQYLVVLVDLEAEAQEETLLE